MGFIKLDNISNITLIQISLLFTDAISLFNNYANGQTQSISVAAALEEATYLFQQIENRDDFDTMKNEAEIELGLVFTQWCSG